MRAARRRGPTPSGAPALAAALLALAAAGFAVAAPGPAPRALGHGAWSWFGDPRAVTYEGRYRRTYVGWIDGRGDVRISAFDHRAGRLIQGAVLKRGLGRDDHNNPSILIRPDGRLMVFFSPHSGRHLPPPGIPSRMYYRVSRRPEDVRRFGPLHVLPTNTPGRLGYTYPNPVRLGRTVFLFWRGGNWLPSLSTWRRGRGWSRARTVIRVGGGRRPYVKYAPAGRGAIDLAFTEGNPGSVRTSIYYVRLGHGRFHRADGSPAGALSSGPLAPARADRVYDGRGPAGRAWVLDTAVGAGGRPVILFASYASRRRMEYRYGAWTGRRWRQRRIVAAGPPIAGNYPAGASLDPEDPTVVVLSRRVRDTYEIERWQTRDGGRTWTSVAITSGSRERNVRPVVPRGPRSGIVVWMRGGYRGYTDYMTRIVLRRGARARAVVGRPIRLEAR